MIVERAPESKNLSTVPSYVAINAVGCVLGVGNDSGSFVDKSNLIRSYREALRSGSMSQSSGQASEPAMRARLAAYSEIMRELESLRSIPESDDLGRIRPSEHAIGAASKLAFRMAGSSAEMPLPEDISTDRDGAVRVLWEYDDRTLELVCPFEASERAYIYYSDANQYRIAYDLSSPQRLARLLCWLKATSSEFPK